MNRRINEIILHCADTKITQSFSIKDIRKWHVEERGWSDVGYHYYIRLNGKREIGRHIEKSGAHAKNHNSNSIGVCFEGGKLSNGDKWTCPLLPQMQSYTKLKDYLFAIYGDLKVSGHYEYSSKTCPNFNIDLLE